MITVKSGRAKHQRTAEEEELLISSVMEGLSAEEAKAVLQIIQEAQRGSSSTLQAHTNLVFERDIVPMRQWLDDEYYFGKPCKNLYPKLKEKLCEIFEDNSRYTTLILTGSIGWGKSFCGGIIFCRVLYELSCFRDPASIYGLAQNSDLYLVLLSKNLNLARTAMLASVMEKLRQSPYFLTEFPFEERQEEVHFPKGINIKIGSVGAERFLGLNVVTMVMDETNFLGVSRNKPAIKGAVGQKMNIANFDIAEKVYATLTNRIKNRTSGASRHPGKSILISSKTTTSSFTERRIRENAGNSDTHVMDFATWDVKQGESLDGPTFNLLVGGHTARSRILEKGDVVPQEFLDTTGSQIIKVPMKYHEDFLRDLNGSIRDIAGLSTDAISSFISKQSAIYEPTIREELFHPFTSEQWVIGLYFAVKWIEIAHLQIVRLATGHLENHWTPKRNPQAPRVIHIDTSMSGDSTGIAMGHITRYVEVERRTPGGEETYIEAAPEYEIDFVLSIRPQMGEYIMLSDIRGLIYEFMDHGFQIVRVSSDTYQSAENIQHLRAKGIDSDILSLDTSPAGYECLRLAMYEGRLRMYRFQAFIDECLGLERDPISGKIDHQIGGCFTGDTFIRLSDDQSMRIDQMVGKSDISIVSYDGTKSITALAVNPRLTKFVYEIVEIVFENGETVRCTPDHRFLLEDGSYIEARYLTSEHALKSHPCY